MFTYLYSSHVFFFHSFFHEIRIFLSTFFFIATFLFFILSKYLYCFLLFFVASLFSAFFLFPSTILFVCRLSPLFFILLLSLLFLLFPSKTSFCSLSAYFLSYCFCSYRLHFSSAAIFLDLTFCRCDSIICQLFTHPFFLVPIVVHQPHLFRPYPLSATKQTPSHRFFLSLFEIQFLFNFLFADMCVFVSTVWHFLLRMVSNRRKKEDCVAAIFQAGKSFFHSFSFFYNLFFIFFVY